MRLQAIDIDLVLYLVYLIFRILTRLMHVINMLINEHETPPFKAYSCTVFELKLYRAFFSLRKSSFLIWTAENTLNGPDAPYTPSAGSAWQRPLGRISKSETDQNPKVNLLPFLTEMSFSRAKNALKPK